MKTKILIVDDEELLVKGIRFNLENEGYEVVSGSDGLQAVELTKKGGIDLIVLDLMMPNMDGMEACRNIRQFSDVPIIMLTAKSEDMDKLMGFDFGADDYMTKPFNILELKARIRALLRRSAGSAKPASSSQITIGTIAIDSERRTAHRNGVSAELTAKEFDVVELLMKNPGRVYSRENLLDTVWGVDYQGDIRTVDVHMRRLREKLELDPAHPQYLMTKWGVGYYFNSES